MLDTEPLRVAPGSADPLADRYPDSRQGFEGGKAEAVEALASMRARLADLQELLWAERRRSLLVVLQAMDTGGKDGTIRRVFSGVNPLGVKVWSFGAPTPLEQAQDFLWRIHDRVPAQGTIGVFNRSHYEDVLVARVKGLVPEEQWSRRYRHIRCFEEMLTDEGTVIVKLFLHISKEEQRERLQARLDNREKMWKFHKSDLADRELWEDFQEAYRVAISETSTESAPWYVIPADRKWYRNLAVSSVLIATLERMGPQAPDPDPGLEGLVVH